MRIFWLLILVFWASSLKAQKSSFAHHNYAVPESVPAGIGEDNYALASIQYKDQKLVGADHMLSTLLFAKAPIIIRRNNRIALGLAFSENKINGVGNWREQVFSSTLAYAFYYSKHRGISFGMNMGLISKKVDLTGIQTGEMWTLENGFDPSLSSGEYLESEKILNPVLNASAYWFVNDKHENPVFYMGLALFQLNEVKDSFYEIDSQSNHGQMTLLGGYRVYDKYRIALIPKFIITRVASRNYLKLGMDFNYSFAQFKNQVSRRENSLNFEIDYQIEKGAQFALQYLQPKYIVGLAYHIDVGQNTKGNIFNNALEVLIQIRNPMEVKSPKQKNRRSRNPKLRKSKKPKKKTTKRKEDTGKKEPAIDLNEEVSDEVTNNDLIIPIENTMQKDSIQTTELPDSIEVNDETGTSIPKKDWKTSVLYGKENTLHFDFNSTDINEVSYNKLIRIAQLLKEYSNTQIILIGYTDNIGSSKRNLSFSKERAKAAARILSTLGIPSSRIIVQGKGESEPFDTNSTEKGRRNNRRIEYYIIEKN